MLALWRVPVRVAAGSRFAQIETVLDVGVLIARIDERGCRFHSQKDARGDEEEERCQECFETGAQLLLMPVVERVLIRHNKLYWVELREFVAVTSTLISRLRSKKRRPPSGPLMIGDQIGEGPDRQLAFTSK